MNDIDRVEKLAESMWRIRKTPISEGVGEKQMPELVVNDWLRFGITAQNG